MKWLLSNNTFIGLILVFMGVILAGVSPTNQDGRKDHNELVITIVSGGIGIIGTGWKNDANP